MAYSTSTYSLDSDENGHICGLSTDSCCGHCLPQRGDGVWQSYSTPNSSNLSVQREFGHRTPQGMSYTEYHSHEEMNPALPNPFYYDSSSSAGTVAGPSGQQRYDASRPQSIHSPVSNANQAAYQSYGQQGMVCGQSGGQQPQNIPHSQGTQGYGSCHAVQGGGAGQGGGYAGSPLAYGMHIDDPPPGPGYSDGGYEGDGSYPASYNSGPQSVGNGGGGGAAGSYSSSHASSSRRKRS